MIWLSVDPGATRFMTVSSTETTIWQDLREDLHAHVSPDEPAPSLFRGLGIAMRSPGFRVGLIYRCSRGARSRFGRAGRVASAVLFWINRRLHGCSIAPSARIGGGLIIPHAHGIVIGPGAEIGPRAWIYQNVTIGGAPGREGMPRVGRDARIFCGAVLTGPVALGDNVVVGANAVVVRDVPDRTLVRSAPVELEPLPERYRVEDAHE